MPYTRHANRARLNMTTISDFYSGSARIFEDYMTISEDFQRLLKTPKISKNVLNNS